MKIKKIRKNVYYGIGAKTTISHLSLAVLLIVFAAISMFFIINAHMRNDHTDRLLEWAENISKLESGPEEFVHDEALEKDYEVLTDSSIIFFDAAYTEMNSLSTGHRISLDYRRMSIEWDIEEMMLFEDVDPYLLASILSGEKVSVIHSFRYLSKDIIIAGAPIYSDSGEVIAGVLIMQPFNILKQQRAIMGRLLLIIAIIAIPIALLISLQMAKRLTRPLIELSEGAQHIAEGNYGARIEQTTTDEIGALANSLNSLTSRLRRSIGSLRRERDMLDMVMNGINEGILAVDWYMHTVHCNESFLRMLELERRPEEVDISTEYGAILKKCMRSHELERTVWTDASGNKLMAVASRLHGEEGIVIGAVCLVIDISESARLDQMRRDYVANVSHELRTPLTGIRGMVEPLIDGVFETEEERQDCYNIIYKETIRLEKLIQEMLDMSRLQDGRVTVDIEPIEVTQLLYDAARRISQGAEDAGIRVNIDTGGEEGSLLCMGNEDRVLQALTIFLDNALSFTPNGGTITVYARKQHGYLKMGVSDTGCGIEPKDMPYIWERFYKVDKSRMRTKGTGLGLAIAKLVVELMNGEIGLNSEPSKGADFWFRLPSVPKE